MSNIFNFPSNKSRITPQEIYADLGDAIEKGEVEYLLIVSMGPKSEVWTAMSTAPAHCLVYMNQYQRLKLEALMRDKELVE